MEIFDRRALRNTPQVRLVTSEGNRLVRTEDALKQAYDQGLDLVVVSDKSNPPVCRIMDFKKAEYEKKKAHKKSATTEVKEIQLKMNIADHDLNTKINKARAFIERGDKVKLNIRFKGREREMPERVKDLINRAIAALGMPVKVTPSGYGIVLIEKP